MEQDVLHIAICEDTPEDASLLQQAISRNPLPAECTVFTDGESFLRMFSPGAFDLILSDIFMKEMSGIQMIEQVRRLDPDVPVAFVTTSKDFALESYRLSALQYIEKPYEDRQVDRILRLARMEKDSAPGITLRQNGKEERILLRDIMYLEQQTHHVTLSCKGGRETQINERLSALAPQLEDGHFFIPHKSFGVNLSYVRLIDPELKCFTMVDGTNIPIRRELMGKARQALKDYLFGITRGEHT